MAPAGCVDRILTPSRRSANWLSGTWLPGGARHDAGANPRTDRRRCRDPDLAATAMPPASPVLRESLGGAAGPAGLAGTGASAYAWG